MYMQAKHHTRLVFFKTVIVIRHLVGVETGEGLFQATALNTGFASPKWPDTSLALETLTISACIRTLEKGTKDKHKAASLASIFSGAERTTEQAVSQTGRAARPMPGRR